MYNSFPPGIRKFPKLKSLISETLLYIGGAKAVFNKKTLNQYYTITIDGTDFSGVYGTINIANGPCYGGNKKAVTTAMPNDGVLDAMFFRCKNSFKAASLIIPYAKGQYHRFPKHFILKKLKKIEIHSNEPLHVDLDGEVFFDTSLKVEVIPAAVKIVAPGGINYARMA
jgi:diacylglycerol kinase family enzyme